MKDENKTKEQLINELAEMRQRIAELETSETKRKHMEQALRESEEKFRGLAEKSLVGIYLIQNGVFKYVNPRLAEIFGYTVEELIDKKGPKDLTLPEDWPIVRENLRKRISGEVKSIHYDFRGITKDKETIYIEVYGSQTVYQGQPAVIGTLLDITQRKRAEKRVEYLNLVLRAIRKVNELLVREKDRDRLLQGTCDRLIETRGYYTAWIAILDDSGRLVTTAEAGFGEDFLPMVDRLERGEWPNCGRRALSQPGVVVIEDLVSACGDCPLAEKYCSRGA